MQFLGKISQNIRFLWLAAPPLENPGSTIGKCCDHERMKVSQAFKTWKKLGENIFRWIQQKKNNFAKIIQTLKKEILKSHLRDASVWGPNAPRFDTRDAHETLVFFFHLVTSSFIKVSLTYSVSMLMLP